MSEYAGETDYLESIIKIEPEEFETIQEKAADNGLKSNITDRVEPSELGDTRPVVVNPANSGESRQETAETLVRKGNKGKRSKDPHSCCLCKKVFSCRRAVMEHLDSFHLKTKQMSCDQCPKIFFTNLAIIKHMRTAHSGKKFACNQCDYKTTRKYCLESHRLTHAAKTECPICNKEISSLKIHMLVHKPKVPCQVCQKLILPSRMKRHMKTHAIQKCDGCEETFHSNEDLRRHKLRSHFEGNLYECHCGAVYSSIRPLREHQHSHNEEQATCDVCQKHFSSTATLKYHRNKQHGLSEEKVKVLNTSGPFICDKCESKFSSRGSFRHHILVHRNFKFSCDLCPRSFNRKIHLARHMEIHLKLRPFQCDVCQHKASSRGNLKLHKLQHGSKKKCQVCHKLVFNMTVHLRNHVKAKCLICGEVYTKDYLRKHLKTHKQTH